MEEVLKECVLDEELNLRCKLKKVTLDNISHYSVAFYFGDTVHGHPVRSGNKDRMFKVYQNVALLC